MASTEYKYELFLMRNTRNGIMDAAKTLDFYRTSYEDEISRKELEANLTSLEAWASYAHANKLLYHVYVRLAETEQPYADIVLNGGNVVVRFLDEYHRKYMIYTFVGTYEPGRLFLESLHYFEYPDAQWATPARSSADTQYIFTLRTDDATATAPKLPGISGVDVPVAYSSAGQLTVRREYSKADGQRYQSEQTAADFVDLTPNWEPAPTLGEYAGVLLLKRWGEEGGIVPLPASQIA